MNSHELTLAGHMHAGEDLHVTASVDHVVVHFHVLFPLHGILISADETEKAIQS
jgi:hypothetical protein